MGLFSTGGPSPERDRDRSGNENQLSGVVGPSGERPAGALRATPVEQAAIERLVQLPSLDLAQMRAIVAYFGSADFPAQPPAHIGQATLATAYHATDPEAVTTPHGPVHRVYRLTLRRSAVDPSIVLRATLQPEYLELGRGVRLTAAVAATEVDGQPIAHRRLMLKPSTELTIEREVLQRATVWIRDVNGQGVNRFESIDGWRIGTRSSLGVWRQPGRIVMVEGSTGVASPLECLTGCWRPTFTTLLPSGQSLRILCEREGGFLVDRALKVRNGGSEPILVCFDLPPHGRR